MGLSPESTLCAPTQTEPSLDYSGVGVNVTSPVFSGNQGDSSGGGGLNGYETAGLIVGGLGVVVAIGGFAVAAGPFGAGVDLVTGEVGTATMVGTAGQIVGGGLALIGTGISTLGSIL